jgi:amino acid transporter
MGQDIFVRKSTGLVREIGIWGGLFFNIAQGSCMAATPGLNPFFFVYGNSGNVWLAVIIGTVGALAVNSIYAHFVAAMPRSGGEYVFLGRTMHPLLGFVVNWTMAVCLTFWVAFNTYWYQDATRVLLYGIFPVESVAWITTPIGAFLFGAAMIVIEIIICLIGMKSYIKLQGIVWALAIIMVVFVGAGYVTATGNFPAIFNSWAHQFVPTEPDMYHKIISDAAAKGFSMNRPEGPVMEQTLTFAAQVFAFLCPYLLVSSYVAGEFKKAESVVRQHIILEGAIIAFILIWILQGWAWMRMAGVEFLASFAFLGGVPQLPLTILSWSWARVVLPLWAAELFIFACWLSVFVASLNLIIAISRCVLAWSFDRLLPSQFAHVSDRFKSPTYAVVAIGIVAIVIWGLATNAPIYTYITAVGFWTLVNIVIVSIAGILFPYLRKDMFDLMPSKIKIGGIPLLTIISTVALAIALWTSTAYFTNPQFSAYFGVTTTAISFSILIYALAVVIFYVSRAYRKRQGINLDLAFKQIPPA